MTVSKRTGGIIMREVKGFNMTQTINVVDAMCGAGKTSWAIQQINENIGQNRKR
jgi:hypothetical protein